MRPVMRTATAASDPVGNRATLDEAIAGAPWTGDGRWPTAVELERWLAYQRPSIRVEYLAGVLEDLAAAGEPPPGPPPPRFIGPPTLAQAQVRQLVEAMDRRALAAIGEHRFISDVLLSPPSSASAGVVVYEEAAR